MSVVTSLSDLLSKVEAYANEHYDGHFTLMKFTSGWKACYGTIEDREKIAYMCSGKTKEEVLQNLLDDPIDVYQIAEIGEDEFFICFEQTRTVYAIKITDNKINDKYWLRDVSMNHHDDWVHVFSTEKKAQKELDYVKKHSKKLSSLDLKVVEVEEELFVDSRKGIHKQIIKEL